MPKINIEKDEKIQEGEVVDTHWDLKKLLVGAFVLAVFVLVGMIVFFPGKNRGPSIATLGAETENDSRPTPPLPDKEDVQGIIDSAKDTLSHITSDNLTASGAALQKVISDLQSLQGSGSAVDIFCNFVCKK